MSDTERTTSPAPSPAARGTARRLPTGLAVGCVCAFVVLLGLRTLTTPDLGYHLSYGERLLDTGRIVDDAHGLWPTIPPGEARYELPPGAWVDENGAYRFPNANWLSQAVIAAVHRLGGPAALSFLLAGLVAAIAAVSLATMRRLGVGPVTAAAGLGLTALVAYERFLLRPELFGYLVLACQLLLLSPPRAAGGADPAAAAPAGPSRRALAAVVLLQVLLVNFHSYFLLGLGLTGAVLLEAAAGRLAAAIGRRPADPQALQAARRRLRWLAWALAGQAAACFVNPWTWRLAVLPIRTLAFMSAHHIAGAAATDVGHPWAIIGEFFRPFAAGIFEQSKASYAYCVLLGVAGGGVAGALLRRRWAHALIIAAMAAVSLTMRRNIAPAAILLVPPAASAGSALLRAVGARRRFRLPAGSAAAGLLVAAAGAWGAWAVVTQRFYSAERRAVRFGTGISRTVVPVSAGAWIREHNPAGRVWTDYNCSSNVHYFARRATPVLTNTWAYPPDVMRLVLDCSLGRRPFEPVARRYGVQLVVLRMDRTSIPLGRALEADPNWVVAHIDAVHVVFLRADGPNAALARAAAITPRTLDVPAFIRRLAAADPVPSFSIYLGGFTLAHLGWDTQAVAVIDHVLANYPRDPYRHRLWNMRGTCLARRGTLRMLRNPPDHRGKADWQEAENSFLRAIQCRPDYPPPRRNLAEVRRQIRDEKRGILYKYPW